MRTKARWAPCAGLLAALALMPAAAEDDLDRSDAETTDGESLALELEALQREVSRQVAALKTRARVGNTGGLEQAKQALEDLRDQLAILLPIEEEAPAPRLKRKAADLSALALSDLRSALTLFSAEHGGDYPDHLEALVPAYLKTLPTPALPEHPLTAAPRVLRRLAEDAELEKELRDSGGWLYIADPKNPYFGSLLIDCTHRNSKGEEWYRQ